MLSGDRQADVEALAQARTAAWPPGEFVGQENFMTAGEILDLAQRARFGPSTRVLDLCCGVAGPGNHVARHTGARMLGVDADAGAVRVAREAAARLGLPSEFVQGRLPDVPLEGPFDGVMLLETLLAFRDKVAILERIADWLRPGGTFALTVEEGRPLDAAEQAAMPASDTVWPVPLAELEGLLARSGLRIAFCADHTASHLDVVRRLRDAYREVPRAQALVASHSLWAEWMASGRVRKFALVAEKAGT